MASQEYFVSPSGSDDNPGTLARPFRTITKGVSVLKGGDILNLRQGEYVESVEVRHKHGSAETPIVIRSFPGEHATIDGSVSQFRTLDNDDWEPASQHDPDAHPEEYVSRDTFPADSSRDRVNRGAFLDRDPYTRLITHSRLEDLRAKNQTFDVIKPGDSRPGPEETDKDGNPTGFRRPWVYMGPGVFFDKKTGRVHIRLSHTRNGVDGLADYEEETDPRRLRLAISHKDRATMVVADSCFLRFENLVIRFGGENTVEIRGTEGVVFDHVALRASSHGVRVGGGNSGLIFRHCELDGGLPTWYFRTDRKAQYHFKVGNKVVLNVLGKQTSRALVFGNRDNSETEFEHCEFVNAHDLYLFGKGIVFHHNWIDNLNDESLFLDAVETDDVRIHENAITRCLSAVSFAGNKVGGRTFVYRNLIDLRSPTGGVRPRSPGDKDVFRFGQLYKSNKQDGPLDLFQNTCLVSDQDGQASYLHYRNTKGTHARRSFNNIFIAVNPDTDSNKAISFVPSPSFPGPTDGNCYFRIGQAQAPLLRFLAYEFKGEDFDKGSFADLDSLRGSELFEQSKTRYPPGYEANSIEADPRFRRISPDGKFQPTDDLRLRANSAARNSGIVLPDELLKTLDPFDPPIGKPDIGCYPFGSPGLRVGVDGRRQFPQEASDQ